MQGGLETSADQGREDGVRRRGEEGHRVGRESRPSGEREGPSRSLTSHSKESALLRPSRAVVPWAELQLEGG